MTGAIYHFTDGSNKRPIVVEKQIKELQEFATNVGVDVEEVYLDRSLILDEREEFRRFIDECDKYEVLITKDFYHISKNTRACMDLMKELRDRGITIYSIENGTFCFEDTPVDKPLRVVSYTHADANIRDVNNLINVQNDIYSLFVKKKTNWDMGTHYADICIMQNDKEQEELREMIKRKDEFDIIIVNNLNDIHWRTSKFCKIREALGKDIYSLQDGYLRYKKEK